MFFSIIEGFRCRQKPVKPANPPASLLQGDRRRCFANHHLTTPQMGGYDTCHAEDRPFHLWRRLEHRCPNAKGICGYPGLAHQGGAAGHRGHRPQLPRHYGCEYRRDAGLLHRRGKVRPPLRLWDVLPRLCGDVGGNDLLHRLPGEPLGGPGHGGSPGSGGAYHRFLLPGDAQKRHQGPGGAGDRRSRLSAPYRPGQQHLHHLCRWGGGAPGPNPPRRVQPVPPSGESGGEKGGGAG